MWFADFFAGSKIYDKIKILMTGVYRRDVDTKECRSTQKCNFIRLEIYAWYVRLRYDKRPDCLIYGIPHSHIINS